MSAPPTDDDIDTLELVEVPAELRRTHGLAVSYQRLWAAAVNGIIPARRVGRRWNVRRGDLPRIAAVLAGPRPPARAEPAGYVPAAT